MEKRKLFRYKDHYIRIVHPSHPLLVASQANWDWKTGKALIVISREAPFLKDEKQLKVVLNHEILERKETLKMMKKKNLSFKSNPSELWKIFEKAHEKAEQYYPMRFLHKRMRVSRRKEK